MPRGPEPSWEMKKKIIDFAAKEGQDSLSVIQRDLDKLTRKEESLEGESTPDDRTIKRVIEEFQTLDQELVVREFAPYVWKMRHDFEEIKAHLETEERVHVEPKELLSLLHRWREQAQYWSVDQVLRQYFIEGFWGGKLQRCTSGTQLVTEIYDAARRHHAHGQTPLDRVLLPVEEEGLLHWLRQCYPTDAVWEAQDYWGQACAACFKAICSWYADTKLSVESLLAVFVKRGLPQEARDIVNMKDVLDQLKKKDANLVVYLDLASVVVCCDLLTLGIAELPSEPLWFSQVNKLKTLRDDVINHSTELPGDSRLALNNIHGSVWLFWEFFTEVKENTRELVHKLQQQQDAQNDLRNKLMALELRLYAAAE